MEQALETETFLGDAPKTGWNDDYSAQEFWNVCHNNKSLIMLSGNTGEQIIANLRIQHLIKPNINLLNIGVGMGLCTEYYAKQQCNVSVMDISDVALQKVKRISVAGYLASNLSELPKNKFDLAISHLVAQHTENADLKTNLEAVIASLNNDGVYAIQITYPILKSAIRTDWTKKEAKAGSITRTCSEFSKMVEDAGGIIENIFTIALHPEYNFGWYGCHIRKMA
jgi:cyclopropane fatty-acyl-phospholipid synthase-like methyltransferase